MSVDQPQTSKTAQSPPQTSDLRNLQTLTITDDDIADSAVASDQDAHLA